MQDDETPALPIEVVERLAARGIQTIEESALRTLLEARVETYTLYRLSRAAARKWQAYYRIMLGAVYIDCQTAVEAYARAFLLVDESLD